MAISVPGSGTSATASWAASVANTLNGTSGDAWTSYTPTLVQSGTVTKTVTYARYMKIGRLVTVSVALAVTGTGTAANAVQIGLPAHVPVMTSMTCGTGILFDSSANIQYPALAAMNGTTAFILLPASATAVTGLGATTFTAAIASGDVIRATLTYEATA